MLIKPIATIRTEFPQKFGIPRQSGLVPDLVGVIEFEAEYRNPDIIRGLEGYSHIWILWEFSEVKRESWNATVAPPRLGGRKRVGVFASRSPYRPNPIGLSSVKVESIDYDDPKGPLIVVKGIDILDGTPIYDIKPYLPHVDCHVDAIGGFAAEVSGHSLEVHMESDLTKTLDDHEIRNIKGILSQDPRTAFIHDDDRIWGISYGKFNIRFTVKDNVLTVREITSNS